MRGTTRARVGLVVIGIGLVACMSGGDQPLAPTQRTDPSALPSPVVRRSLDLPGLPLLRGSPPSYLVCVGNGGPYTGSATLGLLGGKVTFGPHELDVPPLALLKQTTITARTLPGDTIAVAFEPQGLTFLVPATLQLSYAQCNPQPQRTVSILYVNDLLDEILGIVESLDERAQHKVIGPISHFSLYAAAE